MRTVHINFYSTTPASPEVLAAARRVEEHRRTDCQKAVVHLLPIEALMAARPEIEHHAYATGIDPVVEEGGERV